MAIYLGFESALGRWVVGWILVARAIVADDLAELVDFLVTVMLWVRFAQRISYVAGVLGPRATQLDVGDAVRLTSKHGTETNEDAFATSSIGQEKPRFVSAGKVVKRSRSVAVER